MPLEVRSLSLSLPTPDALPHLSPPSASDPFKGLSFPVGLVPTRICPPFPALQTSTSGPDPSRPYSPPHRSLRGVPTQFGPDIVDGRVPWDASGSRRVSRTTRGTSFGVSTL